MWTNPDGNRNVPYLYKDDNERNLNLNWWDNEWNDNYRFMAVCNRLQTSSSFGGEVAISEAASSSLRADGRFHLTAGRIADTSWYPAL